MHAALNSLRKRWYALTLINTRCAREWSGRYWDEEAGLRVVRCRRCPKFSPAGPRCTVPFGSPLRKCVTAAQEAHLHSLAGKALLEIGFGRHSLPRTLVTRAGGTWTGIDPFAPRETHGRLGTGGYGHVADIPFPDATFDLVAGIQTLEHWAEPLPGVDVAAGYAAGLAEVFRVLKPGGSIYFDAPIHLHGHEMFVAGDVERIRGLFDPAQWRDLAMEQWREDYAPLERYPPPEADSRHWRESVTSYARAQLEQVVAEGSVWLLTVRATKRREPFRGR